jgi:WhiB family transcriptional regulator, redox-sensing transcriptional regulator
MNAWHESCEDVGWSGLWSWRLRAACRDVDSAVFFSPDGERGPKRAARETRAKAICAGCPVIRQCATHAIRYGERYGIWGGLSERERLIFRLATRPSVGSAFGRPADPTDEG